MNKPQPKIIVSFSRTYVFMDYMESMREGFSDRLDEYTMMCELGSDDDIKLWRSYSNDIKKDSYYVSRMTEKWIKEFNEDMNFIWNHWQIPNAVEHVVLT